MSLQLATPLRAYLLEARHTVQPADPQTTLRRLIGHAGVLDEVLSDGSRFIVVVAPPDLMEELKGHAAPAPPPLFPGRA